MSLISTHWFPAYGFCETSDALSDRLFDDFDHQSEQFTGHDQSYLQLTPGSFRGRFLSAFLGEDVAIHMEFCNQALEQEVCGSPDHFSFGVILSEPDPFFVKGREFSADEVFVLPPSGNLHLVSPLNGAIMAIAIRRDLLLRLFCLAAPILDWFENLGREVGFLRRGLLARRLREDAVAALEGISPFDRKVPSTMVGLALANSVASKISLEWAGGWACEGMAGTLHYERFRKFRDRLFSEDALPDSGAKLAKAFDVSKRSVEQAFAANVSMGPLTYLRVHRLHEVRRKLMDSGLSGSCIGDIAAEHGFWDWSRFSKHYRHQFGELPSATRQNRADRTGKQSPSYRS